MPRIPITTNRGWHLAEKAEKKDTIDPVNNSSIGPANKQFGHHKVSCAFCNGEVSIVLSGWVNVSCGMTA